MLQRAEHQSRWRLGCFKKEGVFSSKNIVQTDPRTLVWMEVLSAYMRVWVCTCYRISVVPLAGGRKEDLKETLTECVGLNDIMWVVKAWEKLQFCPSLASHLQTTEWAIVDPKCVRCVGLCVCVWKASAFGLRTDQTELVWYPHQ